MREAEEDQNEKFELCCCGAWFLFIINESFGLR
jgi:hypothetical protein